MRVYYAVTDNGSSSNSRKRWLLGPTWSFHIARNQHFFVCISSWCGESGSCVYRGFIGWTSRGNGYYEWSPSRYGDYRSLGRRRSFFAVLTSRTARKPSRHYCGPYRVMPCNCFHIWSQSSYIQCVRIY